MNLETTVDNNGKTISVSVRDYCKGLWPPIHYRVRDWFVIGGLIFAVPVVLYTVLAGCWKVLAWVALGFRGEAMQ